jgi:histone H1/5
MKAVLLVLAFAPIGAFGSHASSFSAMFGDKNDAGSVMAKLQDMMGASQRKLQVAQRHHKKVVAKMRKEAESWLQQEANAYGKYFNAYASEMAQAQEQLQEAVADAKASLARSEKESSHSVNDWKDPAVEERAKLGAQVASAERNIKKTERRAARKVEESEEHSEETMEDHGTKLGFKLGDMTPLVDDAKKTLHAVADKATPAAKVVAKVDASKKVDLKAVEDKLAKASKNVLDAAKEANKKMDGFLSKTDKEVGDKRVAIENHIEAAQKQEIDKVLGRAPAAPVAKKEAAKKAAPKAVPAQKVAAPVKKAAGPIQKAAPKAEKAAATKK